MSENSISPQEKKLGTLRRILWIAFIGIAIPAIIFLMPLYWMRELGNVGNRFSGVVLLMGPFVLIAGLSVVCLLIYNIFKYRLEKDEDLFL